MNITRLQHRIYSWLSAEKWYLGFARQHLIPFSQTGTYLPSDVNAKISSIDVRFYRSVVKFLRVAKIEVLAINSLFFAHHTSLV